MKAPTPCVYRPPRGPYDWDEICKRFKWLMTGDFDIEFMVSRLGPLFAQDPPETYGPWLQHIHRHQDGRQP